MRGNKARGLFVAFAAVVLILAAAGSAMAASDMTLTTRSITAVDNSLTIAVESLGDGSGIHGNWNRWTSPIDPSETFEWFNKGVTITDYAFPDTLIGPVTLSPTSPMYGRNTGTGYSAFAPIPVSGKLEDNGVYSIVATGTDATNDVTGTITPAFGIDQTDPVVTTNAQSFYAGSPVITLNATDSVSGIENVFVTYAIDHRFESFEPTMTDPGHFSIDLPFVGEGAQSFSWTAFDNAGNLSHGSSSFSVDNTAPHTTSDLVAVYNGSGTIHLTAVDPNGALGSGVAHTYYKVDGGPQTEGVSIAVTAPANGFVDHTIEFWSVDKVGNAETPHVTGTYRVNSQHTITVRPQTGGTVSPAGVSTVNLGADSPAYSIKPSPGYFIYKVYIDGVSQGALTTYTFTNVTANHDINVVFGISKYTLTPSRSNSNGTISPSGKVTLNYGSTKTFTMKAKSGHKITKVVVDGKSAGVKTSYKFSNVKANHTIKVYFN